MNERGVIYMTWKDAVGLALEGREEGYNLLRGKCPDPPGKVLHLHVRT